MAIFHNPSSERIRELLISVENIAVVGLSPKPDRPSFQVAQNMQAAGYHIIPVRPATKEILGEPAYKNLAAIDQRVDLVNVFLNPSRLPILIDQCIEASVPAIWLQLGVVDETQALRAQGAGIEVIMDRCLYLDYNALNVPAKS